MSVAVAPGALVNGGTSVRFPGKYVSVVTYRHSGEPVSTPVWFVEADGRLYVDTDGASGKAKRIRSNPRILVAPCSAAGRLKAAPVPAVAEIVDAMPADIREAYTRKYRVDRIVILPVYRLIEAVKRGRARQKRPVVLVITPITS